MHSIFEHVLLNTTKDHAVQRSELRVVVLSCLLVYIVSALIITKKTLLGSDLTVV